MKIKDPVTKQKIVLLDSIQIIPTSLRKLLKGFECEILKGDFPHKFVEKNNLDYVVIVPAKKYFENTSENDYKNLTKNAN
jgi:hypothetical protein